MRKEELLNRLNTKQGAYDYTLLGNTITRKEKLSIICHQTDEIGREHGIFYTNADHLLRGDGCPKCRGKYMDKELFVALGNKIHNKLYTYDNFEFVDKSTKGVIHCTKHNIDFEQTPTKHLQGHGCPLCRYEKSAKSKTTSFDKFVEIANAIHNNKYEYDKSTYVNSYTETRIICPKHGEFWQTPGNHTNKHHSQGCPDCGREKASQSRVMAFDEFVHKANMVHKSRYTYAEETYTTSSNIVDCKCPIHGIFKQRGVNHIDLAQGCPKCSNQMSVAEEEIIEWLKEMMPNTIIQRRNRDIIKPYELDIYLPSYKLAIEYNGLVWHSTKFNNDKHHLLNKTTKCSQLGIRLIHIFEDEWQFNKDNVLNRLSAILGLNIRHKIYARKCEIKNVTPQQSRVFLDDNHIQGFCKAKYHYGLFYNNELVSLMTFGTPRQTKSKISNNQYELLRFCNKREYTVVGAASKLLKYFINEIKPNEIISYADKRWSDGGLYKTLGFEHTHDSSPNYFYVIGKHRENRFKYRKGQLVKQGFDETKSEKEIMEERGIPRIYDCGTMVFKLKIETKVIDGEDPYNKVKVFVKK